MDNELSSLWQAICLQTISAVTFSRYQIDEVVHHLVGNRFVVSQSTKHSWKQFQQKISVHLLFFVKTKQNSMGTII